MQQRGGDALSHAAAGGTALLPLPPWHPHAVIEVPDLTPRRWHAGRGARIPPRFRRRVNVGSGRYCAQSHPPARVRACVGETRPAAPGAPAVATADRDGLLDAAAQVHVDLRAAARFSWPAPATDCGSRGRPKYLSPAIRTSPVDHRGAIHFRLLHCAPASRPVGRRARKLARGQPDFFKRNPALMADLRLPMPAAALCAGERQIEVLRDKTMPPTCGWPTRGHRAPNDSSPRRSTSSRAPDARAPRDARS